MCGIAGIVSDAIDRERRGGLVEQMVRALRHRGPDDSGVVTDGIATLGVARLSIVDRRGGHQPLSQDRDGERAWIAYNGEVYNHVALRRGLVDAGTRFRSGCDTEVVLAAHMEHGPGAVSQLDGMFAYAIWSARSGELLLARDRLGIKPLYYVDLGGTLLFASEPKALFRHEGLARRPDVTALLEYFLHGGAFASGYSTGGRSFYEGVRALPAGHTLRWSVARGSRLHRYWAPHDEFADLGLDRDEAVEAVAEAVDESVGAMLMGEVPIGTALSGGLDSSLLTAVATRRAAPMVSSCITYRGDHEDADAHHARLVSDWLNGRDPGCHRLEFAHLREPTYLDRLDAMIAAFDEPHWELRQLAMFDNYRVLAEAGRTVVLTGEGADELFFGYYRKFPGFRSPSVLDGPGDFAEAWATRIGWAEELLGPAFAAGFLPASASRELLDEAVSAYLTPAWQAGGNRLRAVQCWYLQTFLHWLLLDNDRCSMAHGLEGRFPFLSNRLVRLALRLPPDWNVDTSPPIREKVLLRDAARRELPPEIWRDREKAPLPVPDATSYHHLIADRLAAEVEAAPAEIWGLLDRRVVVQLLGSFRRRLASAPASGGQELTAYTPLGQAPPARTAQLFAILSMLRWYDLCIARNPPITG